MQAGATTMSKTPMRIAAICQIIVALAGATAAHAQAAGPCREIVAACREAGFTQGGARTGDGIQVDCVRPIMLGTAPPPRATKPLPQVDPQIVAACKARNPDFGQPNRAPNDARPPSPPPPARTEPAPLPIPPPQAGEGKSINPPALTGEVREGAALPAGAKRPNIVFVLTDDLALNLVQYMPNVRKMQQDGVTFANYFVTDSLCCPSRSSIFTGRYPHNTGIFRNVGEDGGHAAFRSRGLERTTFAVTLSGAGHRTAMLGKYLNGYLPAKDGVPAGWSEWGVAGNGYPGFNYGLNQNGRLLRYGASASDYMTDVLSGLAVRFIKEAGDRPFLIEIATFAPHAPYTPAPRDAQAVAGLSAPRTAAFDAAPDASTPPWLSRMPALTDRDRAALDAAFRKRAQSVLAVDKMIGELEAAVAAIGKEKSTYFVFSSDNGLHMGEHRMMPGKMTAYDIDVHVPLIVAGARPPPGG